MHSRKEAGGGKHESSKENFVLFIQAFVKVFGNLNRPERIRLIEERIANTN
jgi:hypothetical protein